jgi:hypothetical protein
MFRFFSPVVALASQFCPHVFAQALPDASVRYPDVRPRVAPPAPAPNFKLDGVVFQVDDRDEVKLPFLTCLPRGCVASLLLAQNQQQEMVKAKALKVSFRPLGSDKVAIVEVSLKGFDKAVKAL